MKTLAAWRKEFFHGTIAATAATGFCACAALLVCGNAMAEIVKYLPGFFMLGLLKAWALTPDLTVNPGSEWMVTENAQALERPVPVVPPGRWRPASPFFFYVGIGLAIVNVFHSHRSGVMGGHAVAAEILFLVFSFVASDRSALSYAFSLGLGGSTYGLMTALADARLRESPLAVVLTLVFFVATVASLAALLHFQTLTQWLRPATATERLQVRSAKLEAHAKTSLARAAPFLVLFCILLAFVRPPEVLKRIPGEVSAMSGRVFSERPCFLCRREARGKSMSGAGGGGGQVGERSSGAGQLKGARDGAEGTGEGGRSPTSEEDSAGGEGRAPAQGSGAGSDDEFGGQAGTQGGPGGHEEGPQGPPAGRDGAGGEAPDGRVQEGSGAAGPRHAEVGEMRGQESGAENGAESGAGRTPRSDASRSPQETAPEREPRGEPWQVPWKQIALLVVAVLAVAWFMARSPRKAEAGQREGRMRRELARLEALLRSGTLHSISIEELYVVFEQDLQDLGFGRECAETPGEYQRRLGIRFPQLARTVHAVTAAFERCRYGGGACRLEDLATIRNAVLKAYRTIRRMA